MDSSSPLERRAATTNARGRRPSRHVLGRVKVAAIAFSVAVFTGALGGIALANPGVKSQTPSAIRAADIVVPAEPAAPKISSAPLNLPSVQQAPLFMPRTRTRGS